MELKIYDNEKVITIKSVDDLRFLPDKSIEILFSNSAYMTTVYLYVIYRMDAYFQSKGYGNQARVFYFNACIKNLNSLLEYEKEFLKDNSTTFVIKLEPLHNEIKELYKESVIATCNFFSGMLSTTSYLDKKLFSKDDKQRVRHNYGYMISALLGTLNY